jgi:hypothetical protein
LEKRACIVLYRTTRGAVANQEEALSALRLIRASWLQTLHAIGLVVYNNIFFVLFRWRIICCCEFLAKNCVEVSLNIVFSSQVIVVIVVIGNFLGHRLNGNFIWVVNNVDALINGKTVFLKAVNF